VNTDTVITDTVITSWMIFNWRPVKTPTATRLARTARQYSSSAISHDTGIAFQSGHE
jgi:hypothetical protein